MICYSMTHFPSKIPPLHPHHCSLNLKGFIKDTCHFQNERFTYGPSEEDMEELIKVGTKVDIVLGCIVRNYV